jgi:uncharacterized protein
MFSEKMERRKFIKNISSAFLGVVSSRLLSGLPFAHAAKKSPLEYRTLGKTGLKVTAVGMGVMNCSDPAILLRAFDLGVNFYDTAHSYMKGLNEEILGKTFQGKRDKVLIQTKVHSGNKKEAKESVETSLRRLRTDYVDILLWHSLKDPEDVADPERSEFMSKMKKEGKARFTGFSTHSHMDPLLKEAAKSNLHDVVLVAYNYTHSNDLKEAVAMAAKSGIGIIAMKTQAGGYKKEKMGGLSPHQAALKYILMDQNVSTTIPGVTTIEQIEECAAVMGASLSKRDVGELKRYNAFLKEKICTLCGGCSGECPYGVSHHDLLRVVMYHDGYQNNRLIEENLETRALLKDIEICSDCPSCSIVCRRGLDLKAQIRLAQQILA